MEVANGDTIEVEYEGSFKDGTVFDSSKHGDHSHPLKFTVGKGEVVVGFDSAVVGMKKGATKKVTILPEKGYGEHDPKLVQKVPRSMMPEGQEPKKGMKLMMHTPQGQQAIVSITEVTKESVTLDLNHPLAGKTLIFSITVVSIDKK